MIPFNPTIPSHRAWINVMDDVSRKGYSLGDGCEGWTDLSTFTHWYNSDKKYVVRCDVKNLNNRVYDLDNSVLLPLELSEILDALIRNKGIPPTLDPQYTEDGKLRGYKLLDRVGPPVFLITIGLFDSPAESIRSWRDIIIIYINDKTKYPVYDKELTIACIQSMPFYFDNPDIGPL